MYYHVDLLSSLSAGKMLRYTDKDMQAYVWDYAAYPASEAVIQQEPTEPQTNIEPEETLNPAE
jgi:hypothetical protein